MPLRFGTNNLEVKIIDKVGNTTVAIYPIEIASNSDQLEERIDKLEERIEELE